MKKVVLISLVILHSSLIAQQIRHHPHEQGHQSIPEKTEWYPSEDSTYDVHFYHIDLEIAVDSIWLSGQVKFLISSKIDGFNSLLVDLDQTFQIESISTPVSDYMFEENILHLNLETSYNTGDTLSFIIQYSGHPEMAGGYKGLRYETHDGGEPIIASLSTPYLAHSWWPCKDGTSDKTDSLYVDISVKDTTISGLPLLALSNGMLHHTSSNGVMKKYEWRHYYPVVPYYVMVAISNYAHFQQVFEGDGYSFPIDYYVFESHLESAQEGVIEMLDAMAYYSEIFGPYPFLNEKYGMTQLGYYGAIENQTNTITNNMSYDWLDVTVHELAHQWFADDITCENWHHGWVNEGFASYAEALYVEHRDGFEAYQNYVTLFTFKQGGTLYLEDISDPFSGVFQTIIYNKGAYVLHMLRGVLGDENFFNALHNYATNDNFTYGWANTEDFQAICEEVSGEDLGYFFEQWIYDERYPKYRYNYSTSSNQTEIMIQQSQAALGWREIFTMPLEIRFEFEDGSDTLVRIFNDELEQHQAFDFELTVVNVVLDPNSWILSDITFDSNIIVGAPLLEQTPWSLYPNPNHGSFSIQLHEGFGHESIQLAIYDLNGKELLRQAMSSTIQPIHFAEKGIYVLVIQTESKSYMEKLVVL